MNLLSESVLRRKFLPYHHVPMQCNDTGIEYLYHQAGRDLDFATCEDLTQATLDDDDEGFECHWFGCDIRGLGNIWYGRSSST